MCAMSPFLSLLFFFGDVLDSLLMELDENLYRNKQLLPCQYFEIPVGTGKFVVIIINIGFICTVVY